MKTRDRRIAGRGTTIVPRWVIGASILFAGCGPDPSTMAVRVHGSATDPDGLADLVMEVADRRLTHEDFELGADPLSPSQRAVSLEVPSKGMLTLRAMIVQDGSTIADGSTEIAMRENFLWGVDVFRRTTDPTLGCFGCIGGLRIPIDSLARRTPDDALWLVWGGVEAGSDKVF
ncbi:MAG: hypothetical protein ABFS34_16225 [Gemmatimonadota bacterium]